MLPPTVPRLTDGLVTLRAHEIADAGSVHEQAEASVMLRLPGLPPETTAEDALGFVRDTAPRRWRTGEEWTFAVEAPDGDPTAEVLAPRYVGTVGLRPLGDGRAQVVFGSLPWARGRGYVVRALRLLLDWGFGERDLRSVLWTAEKGNWASRKVAWRLGFTRDGTLRRWLVRDGELCDAWVGVLTAADERQPKGPWLEVPRVQGRDVALRSLRDDDLQRLVEACSDERSAYWLTRLPSPYTTDDARSYLETRREQLATGDGLTWAATSPTSDELLGVVSLFDLDPGEDAEVGYWTHPAARGRGVMTEACALVVRHAFVPAEDGGLGLRRMRVEVAEGNDASRHVVEANGFAATGRRRAAHRFRDGSAADLLLYDLLVEEFRPRGD